MKEKKLNLPYDKDNSVCLYGQSMALATNPKPLSS